VTEINVTPKAITTVTDVSVLMRSGGIKTTEAMVKKVKMARVSGSLCHDRSRTGRVVTMMVTRIIGVAVLSVMTGRLRSIQEVAEEHGAVHEVVVVSCRTARVGTDAHITTRS